jgi:hypothetical protein
MHTMGDPQEVKENYENLLFAGKKFGISMPFMEQFRKDVATFAKSEKQLNWYALEKQGFSGRR